MTRDPDKVAGLPRFAGSSTSPSSPPAGLRYGNASAIMDIRGRTDRCAEAGGIVSGIAGDDDPLKTGNVICGNEFVHPGTGEDSQAAGEVAADCATVRTASGTRAAWPQPSPTCPVKPMTDAPPRHDR